MIYWRYWPLQRNGIEPLDGTTMWTIEGSLPITTTTAEIANRKMGERNTRQTFCKWARDYVCYFPRKPASGESGKWALSAMTGGEAWIRENDTFNWFRQQWLWGARLWKCGAILWWLSVWFYRKSEIIKGMNLWKKESGDCTGRKHNPNGGPDVKSKEKVSDVCRL